MNTAIIKRRAPKQGYTTDIKDKYREDVWSYLAPKILPKLALNNSLKVLLLPSKEGFEIDVAIRHGIKENQIVAIDENAAIIATSSWRKKYPRVNFFASKVSEVGKKIEKKGWTLIAANLDFCNIFSQELIDETNSFLNTAPITEDFTFLITMGKGRESKALLSLLNYTKVPEIFKNQRLAVFYHMLNIENKNKLSLNFEKEYYSTFPMIYACFSFKSFKYNYLNEILKRKKVLLQRRNFVNNIKLYRNYYFKLELNEVNKELIHINLKDDDYKKMIEKKKKLKKYIAMNADYHLFKSRKNEIINSINKELTNICNYIESELTKFASINHIICKSQYINMYMDCLIYDSVICRIEKEKKTSLDYAMNKLFG